jgi:hypothetical protein
MQHFELARQEARFQCDFWLQAEQNRCQRFKEAKAQADNAINTSFEKLIELIKNQK